MGCDIHFYVETQDESGIWQHHDWREKYHAGFYEDGDKKYDWSKMFDDPLYLGRNYRLFGILADVRNGHGFAGVDTGDSMMPVLGFDEPTRGLPDDVTPEVKMESDEWDCDGHSHNWLTVQELLNYNWDRTATLRGWVDKQQYDEFVDNGNPSSWCGGVSGGLVSHISNEEMAQLDLDENDRFSYYTLIEWQLLYRDCAKSFLDETLPELQKIGESDKVRVVFWFDN